MADTNRQQGCDVRGVGTKWLAGAEDGPNPEGLRVDSGGLRAAVRGLGWVWLDVKISLMTIAHLYCAFSCAQFCVRQVNLHHRGESLPWPYRGSAVNTASFHWGRNRGTERWDNLPMLMQLVRGKAGLEPKQSDSSAAPWVTGLSCLPSGQVRGTSFVWGSSIWEGKVGSEKGRKLGKTSASLSCGR